MYKINTSTAVNKRFVDGNVSTQTPPTDLNAQWFNHVQQELVNAIQGLGGWVDGVNENSLATAINNFKTAIEARAKSLEARAKSLEDSRTNRMGEIITTTSTTSPPDCLPCIGQTFRKSDFQDFVNYAVSNGYFETYANQYNQAIAYQRWGKLMHYKNDPNNDLFYAPRMQGTFVRMQGETHLTVGTYQEDANNSITNVRLTRSRGGIIENIALPTSGWSGNLLTGEGGDANNKHYTSFYKTGTETRPMNIAVRFWIRFK